MATNNALNVQGPTPLFYVYNTVDYTFITGGTFSITFDTALFDTTSSFTLGTSKYIAPVNGYYLFNAHISTDITNSGTMSFYFEGSMGYRFFSTVSGAVTTGNRYYYEGSYIVFLNAGDEIYVKYNCINATGTAIATKEKTSFSGFLITQV